MARRKTEEESAAAPTTPAPAEGGYLTTDGNEALRYIQVGGKLLSVTKQYPQRLYAPGKRYVFLETKTQLDALLATQEAQ